MTLLMLANQIAIAIHNARLYNLEKSLHALEARKAQELAEVNASKDRFFSIVAHDLRGPFNPLLGLAQLMAQQGVEGVPPDEVRTMAEAIYRSARSIYDLLENLLAWSRLQRGRMDYEAGKLDLKRLVGRNVKLFADVAAGKSISLESMVAEGVSVNADQNMLNAILRNLISNALKFTPCGGQVIINALPEGSDMVAVSVSDTGMGIRPEDQAKLFKLDVTHSTVGTASETGTGLGLIICQEMVEKNGGRIWIESEGVPGRGTTIKFTLPLLEGPLESWEFKPVQVMANTAQVEPEEDLGLRKQYVGEING
jgi:signal transduction histidine kinase